MMRLSYLILAVVMAALINSGLMAQEATADEQKQDTASNTEQKKSNKVYAIRDRYGNITGYTDDPRKGSEEITIQKSTEYTAPETVTQWTQVEPKVVEEQDQYTHFAIASPSNDATIRDNSGNIQIALDIRPALLPDHKVQFLLDGSVVAESRGVIQSLSNVDRGTHSISANILGADNQILKSTNSVTIHLHRATINR